MTEAIAAEFYDAAYFNDGTKSNYAPYGPGDWADWLAAMVVGGLNPRSVLDVGCAYGYMVERYRKAGTTAWGFDISSYAIGESVAPDWVWQGDAADAAAYRLDVDLLTATELPEHLVPDQVRAFLSHALVHAERALLLIAIEDGTDHFAGDLSHVNIQPMSWWETEAVQAGWSIGDSSTFNEDDRAKRMLWDGRFLLLVRP
jgi:SAM-dependent methyltransferase